jgi:hypothetical protein
MILVMNIDLNSFARLVAAGFVAVGAVTLGLIFLRAWLAARRD